MSTLKLIDSTEYPTPDFHSDEKSCCGGMLTSGLVHSRSNGLGSSSGVGYRVKFLSKILVSQSVSSPRCTVYVCKWVLVIQTAGCNQGFH